LEKENIKREGGITAAGKRKKLKIEKGNPLSIGIKWQKEKKGHKEHWGRKRRGISLSAEREDH